MPGNNTIYVTEESTVGVVFTHIVFSDEDNDVLSYTLAWPNSLVNLTGPGGVFPLVRLTRRAP